MKQEEMAPTELAKMTVVYSIPGVEAVTVRRDVPYRETESASLGFDVYYPPGAAPDDRRPAVLIVYGYSDAGVPNLVRSVVQGVGHDGFVGPADRSVGGGSDSVLESGTSRGCAVSPGLRSRPRGESWHRRNASRSLGRLRERPARVVADDAEGTARREVRSSLLWIHARRTRGFIGCRHAEDVSLRQPISG